MVLKIDSLGNMRSSCALVNDTDAVPVDTEITAQDTSVAAVPSLPTVADSFVIPMD